MKDWPHVDPGDGAIERRNPTGFDQAVAPHPAALSRAREELRSQLESWRLSEPNIEDILLIHSELVTNAMQQGTGKPITVTVHHGAAGDRLAGRLPADQIAPKEIKMVVTNRDSVDRVPHPDFWHPAGLLANTGRGLLIVGSLSDRVEVSEDDSQVAVTSWYQLG